MRRRFDIEDESKAVYFEIMTYKWIESEKAGYDIGSNRATQEWIARYYDDWFRWNALKYLRED